MNKISKINRRKFLAMLPKLCTVPLIPYSLFNFSEHNIIKEDFTHSKKFPDTYTYRGAKINIIGVGGAGTNVLNHMIASKLSGVNFIVADTDCQTLVNSKVPVKIEIGKKLTKGAGATADLQIGKQAALESKEVIRNALEGYHMVIIIAGLGGGTGTGAAPIIADICQEIGALTVAVVTKPFSIEGEKPNKKAKEGIRILNKFADTVIAIPNDRLRGLISKDATMAEIFKKPDEILLHSVKGITDLIVGMGLVSIDFEDFKTIFSKEGMASMGTGIASGQNRGIKAAELAISNHLLEDIPIKRAKGVLVNITHNDDFTLEELYEAIERIHKEIDKDVEIIWATAIDDNMIDKMRVTMFLTGIDSGNIRLIMKK